LPHPTHATAPTYPAPADPLPALRQATAALHAQLDTGLAIGRPGASLTDYTHHAQALSAWFQALEPDLKALQAAHAGFAFTPADRLAALKADLADQALAAAAHDSAWPAPSTATAQRVAQALRQHAGQVDAVRWGLAYVVEGSQLGGQVLYRQLAPQLAPHPLRYLQGGGAATGGRWKAFVALLRQHVATAAAIEASCQGALAAFEGLQHHFWEAEGMPT
jgi:heme oxygenase